MSDEPNEAPEVDDLVREAARLGEGHVLLSTRLGPLDCLGALVDGRGFEELAGSEPQ